MAAFKNTGLTDEAALVDSFNIKQYIDGLSEFIKNCETPITISIQGDWGTGKTSIMQMIRKQIDPNEENSVWFNTWQFSQFNMGDNLPILMMDKLVKAVAGVENSGVKESVKKLFKAAFSVGVSKVSGGNINADDIVSILEDGLIEQIEELKDNFQKLVNKKVGDDGRVVIFIDDLDRLAPSRAVELLEVLKIFLDCKKCVFILAIDYNVVARGVKDKYGEDFGDEKGKSFFDKIIQVPFKMPIAMYDISQYLKDCFEKINLKATDEEIEKYKTLISVSTGNNPRSMKRLFNSYLLLNRIASEEVLKSDNNKVILFAILCMQSKYEKIYNKIVERRDNITAEFLGQLKLDDGDVYDDMEISIDEINEFIPFAEALYRVIDKDELNGIDDEELKAFRNVLNFSTITSANANTTRDNAQDSKYHNEHMKMIKRIAERMQMEYPDYPFYIPKYTKGSYFTWGYFDYNNDDKRINPNVEYPMGFECCVVPDNTYTKSMLRIMLYSRGKKKTKLSDIKHILGDNPFEKLGFNELHEDSYRLRYDNILIYDTDKIEENIEPIYEKVRLAFDCVKDKIPT